MTEQPANTEHLVQLVKDEMDSDVRLLVLMTGVTLAQYEERIEGIKDALARRAVSSLLRGAPVHYGTNLPEQWHAGDLVEYVPLRGEPAVPATVVGVEANIGLSYSLRVRFDASAEPPSYLQREQLINPDVMRHRRAEP